MPKEPLDQHYARVRVSYDLFNGTPGAAGIRTIDAYWIEDESDDEWQKFSDGRCAPFRLPSICITDVTPL